MKIILNVFIALLLMSCASKTIKARDYGKSPCAGAKYSPCEATKNHAPNLANV